MNIKASKVCEITRNAVCEYVYSRSELRFVLLLRNRDRYTTHASIFMKVVVLWPQEMISNMI